MLSDSAYELDPLAVANREGLIPRNALFRCEALFACNDTASFEQASFVFRDSGGALLAEKTFGANDCDRSGTCSSMVPIEVPAGSPVTMEIEIRSTGEGHPLDVTAGGDLFAEPKFFVLGAPEALPYGQQFSPFDVGGPVPIVSAAAWLCRHGPAERLNFSFLLEEGA